MPRKKLGEMLIDAGVLTEPGLRQALAEQRRWGGTLGRTLAGGAGVAAPRPSLHLVPPAPRRAIGRGMAEAQLGFAPSAPVARTLPPVEPAQSPYPLGAAVCSAGGDNYCTPHATPVPMVFTSPAGALLTADALSVGASVGVALQGTKVLVCVSNYYAQGANSSQASHFDPKQILGTTPVSGIAAQGLTNREIGQRLYLSHRTISTHLYRIFPKLGITGRGELRAALSQRRQA